MTPALLPWPEVTGEVADALLLLPGDGLLELLTRDVALAVTWLLPDRLLLELSGAPPAAAPALLTLGWTLATVWHTAVTAGDRAQAASAAAS